MELDQLYSKYLKEEEGYDTISTQFGFINYVITGNECLIANLYTVQNERSKGYAQELANQLEEKVREEGVTFFFMCFIFK